MFGEPIETSEWNRNDGFSPGSVIITVVPNVDLGASGAPPLTGIPSSLDDDSPIVLLNADTGERHPFWAELDAWNDDPERTPLLIRPAENLEHDHQVTHTSAEVEARTLGGHVHQRALEDGRQHDDDPYWSFPAVPYEDGRWSGDAHPSGGTYSGALVVWDSGNDTPPVENINPRMGGDSRPDPHGHPRVDPDAMLQMSEFLRAGGYLLDVCRGPCLTMQHPDKTEPHHPSLR